MGSSQDSDMVKKIVDNMGHRIDKFIHIGHNSSNLLMSLVEDILNLSKMGAGKFNIHMSEFYMKDLIDQVYDIFEYQCHTKNINLHVDIEESYSQHMIKSDKSRLKQVLLNILSNAYKFTFEGKITITVEKAKIKDEDYVKFIVSDTGIGIRQSDQSKLFKLFGMINSMKDNNGLSINPSGCGIGLTVSKKYIEYLNGMIHLKSEPGEGTSVTCYVPLIKVGANQNCLSDSINNLAQPLSFECSLDNIHVSQETNKFESRLLENVKKHDIFVNESASRMRFVA